MQLVKTFFISMIICCLGTSLLCAQDLDLANEYFNQQEYEKAVSLYEKLAKNEEMIAEIHQKYISCLMRLEDFKQAEKYLKKRLKNEPLNPRYHVDQALLLKEQESEAAMEAYIIDYIGAIPRDELRLKILGVHLINSRLLSLAEKAYLQGQKSYSESFFVELADLYRVWGKKDQMMASYLDMLAYVSPQYNEEVVSEVQDRLVDDLSEPEDYAMFEKLVYQYLQKYPSQIAYNQMLIWFYLQQKEFNKAFVQARAIDRRMGAEGREIMMIGNMSFENDAFKDAVKIYGYIVEKYPKNGFIYMHSRNMLIKSKEAMVKNEYPVDLEAINSLVDDYQKAIGEFGMRANTAEVVRNVSKLYAFYLNKRDTAVSLLQALISSPRMPAAQRDEAKLDLGDIYVLKEEPWEAALIYAQVEKSQKEDVLGHEAKLRSAKLSYYRGDFKLAKAHLDVLKLATSREIANDAMELSLLIQDNLELDTSAAALTEYAQIDLLVFQGVYTEALNRYKSMLEQYKKHSLTDEILWERANILVKLGKPEEAIKDLEEILASHGDDLFGDDANFLAATLYENSLDNKAKAQEYYINHLLKYPGSIYVAEARKRARGIRGDRQ